MQRGQLRAKCQSQSHAFAQVCQSALVPFRLDSCLTGGDDTLLVEGEQLLREVDLILEDAVVDISQDGTTQLITNMLGLS